MERDSIYPKYPIIGADCSGQPNAPPMIAVATRLTRRAKEQKWVSLLNISEIKKHKGKRNWEEKVYASIVFKSLNQIYQPNYLIHIDEDYQNTSQQKKILRYLHYLFGISHAGDPTREKPDISFQIKRRSKPVHEAHKKHELVNDGKMNIDDKSGIDYLMKLLENQ